MFLLLMCIYSSKNLLFFILLRAGSGMQHIANKPENFMHSVIHAEFLLINEIMYEIIIDASIT